jgi:hypothetical protein
LRDIACPDFKQTEDRVREVRLQSDWQISRKTLTDRPPVAKSDPNKPLWPKCQLLEWYLLSLSDDHYKSLYKGGTIAGTDVPSSGDPILDAEIAAFYKDRKDGC